MGINLTDLYIDETFPKLVQTSGSVFTDGTGSLLTEVDITASNSVSSSYAVSATSSSFSNVSISASYALTADTSISSSQAENANNAIDAINAVNATYAQNTVTTGKNVSGGDIPKGTPLYFTGSGTQGNLVGILIADAGNPDRMPAGGVAGEEILNGEEGVVLLDGFIGGVDTSAFASGDEVFVGVGGGYTNVAPTGSNNLIQHLGNVEKSHQNNGSGVIQMMGEPRGLPNIPSGYVWMGDANDVPQPIPTSSLRGDSFPYTGSALITGSLGVTGSISAQGPLGGTFTYTNRLNGGLRTNEIDFTGQDLTQFRSNDTIAFDNTYFGAGTGSMSFNTNGNLTFNTYAGGDITADTDGNVNLSGGNSVIIDAGGDIISRVGDFTLGIDQNGFVGNKPGGGAISATFNNFNGNSQPTIYFNGDNSYFQANNNMFFENAPGGVGTGRMSFVSNGNINFVSNQNSLAFTSPVGAYINSHNDTYLNIDQNGHTYGSPDSGSVNTSLDNFGGNTAVITNYIADNAFVNASGGLIYASNDYMQFTSNNQGVAFNSPTQIDFNALVFNNPVDINLNGSAFLYTAASNINGFSFQVNQLSVVKPFTRAFVETPLVVGDTGTVEVSDGSVLKVINEL